MKLAILLTATVKVQVRGGNFSVEERAKMYADTLRYYSQAIGRRYPIVFLENSDYDLSAFKKEFDQKLDIEWLQFLPSGNVPFCQEKGKGYNEYLMIKHGLSQSEKISHRTHFLKITGRYAMTNICTMIGEIERRARNKVFMGDIKDTNIYEKLGINKTGHWGDSRFWVANVDYYKQNMADCYLSMDDSKEGRWAEHFLLNLSCKERNNKGFIFRFRHQVQFNGAGGTLTSEQLAIGNHRQDSPSKRMKNMIRHIMRVMFPNFWF